MAEHPERKCHVDPDYPLGQHSSEATLKRIFYGASCVEALIVIIVIVVVDVWGRLPKPMFVSYTALLLWGQVVLWFAFWCLMQHTRLVERNLQHKSFIDGLTGVFNYRYLDERMEEEQERIQRHGGRLSLLFMDLDNFKEVNDRFGHGAGNTVLRELAENFSAEVRGSDIVGRIGGDEFLILLPDTSPEQGHHLAERLTEVVHNYCRELEDGGRVDFVRMSAGVAAFPDHGENMDCVVAAADEAVYEAKKRGGDSARIAEGFCSREMLNDHQRV